MDKLFFDKVVVGGSLTAVLYAYKNNLPIIVDIPHIPFQLEMCPDHWDLSFIGFSNKTRHRKSQVWDRLLFVMAMSGLVVFPNNVQTFRLEEEKIVIITLDNRRIEVSFNEMLEFDKEKTDEVVIYDWFAVRSGARHKYNALVDPTSEFCHTLLFHPSTRKATRNDMKDVCSISTVSEKEKDDMYYSETYARLKTLRMMKEAGIRGQSNGYNKYGKQLHYAVKIEHMYREVYYKYNNGFSIEEILETELDKRSQLWKLTQNLIIQTLTT